MLCWTKYKGYAYDVHYCDPKLCSMKSDASSGVARAFPGGRLAHPEDQNEEENK